MRPSAKAGAGPQGPRRHRIWHMASISLALSKGRIFDETAPLLARVGIRPKEDPDSSRRLVIGTQRRDRRLILYNTARDMT